MKTLTLNENLLLGIFENNNLVRKYYEEKTIKKIKHYSVIGLCLLSFVSIASAVEFNNRSNLIITELVQTQQKAQSRLIDQTFVAGTNLTKL